MVAAVIFKSTLYEQSLITVFQDEVHFQEQTSITRTWAEKGSEPKVMSKPGRKKLRTAALLLLNLENSLLPSHPGSIMRLSYSPCANSWKQSHALKAIRQ